MAELLEEHISHEYEKVQKEMSGKNFILVILTITKIGILFFLKK